MKENFTTGMRTSGPIPPLPYEELLGSLETQIKLTPQEVETYRSLLKARLPPLVRTEILSLVLGVSHKLLFAISFDPRNYYRTFSIHKRSGGKRRIDAPRVFLKTIQRWILRNILSTRELPPFVTGFVQGRSAVTNARFHLKSKYLAKLDIKDFFPSVSRDRCQAVFKSFDYPERVSRLLARLCTFRDVLPQGAPTSPYLANLAFLPCDEGLEQFATNASLRYSRYADDLTFSSDEPIASETTQGLIDTIVNFGFQVNPVKSRSWHPGQRLITTGMVVNEKVQPKRALRRRLRAIFHQAAKNPHRFRSEGMKLVGWAAFVNAYDPRQGHDYLEIARTVNRKSGQRSKPTSG